MHENPAAVQSPPTAKTEPPVDVLTTTAPLPDADQGATPPHTDERPSEATPPQEFDEVDMAKNSPEKQMGRAELKTVGENIINGKIAQFNEDTKGKTKQEVEEYMGDDPEKKALNVLAWITQTEPSPQPIIGGTTPLHLPNDSRLLIVREVMGSDGDALTCKVEVVGAGTVTEQKVPKALLQDALIIEHADIIRTSLPESQQKAFDQYIATLKSGDVTVGADELHTLVKESAVSIGLPTGEVLANLIRQSARNRVLVDGIKDPAEALKARIKSEEAQIRAERVIQDLKLDEMGLLDGKTIAQALIRTGSLDQVTDLIKDLTAQDVEIKTQLKDKDLTKAEHMDLELKLAKNQLERKAYKAALDALDETKVGDALQEVVDGKVPPEITKALGEAMASGDMNKLIEVALKVQSPSEDDVTKARNKAHRDEIAKKLGKTGGIAALAMAIMMYAAMKGTDKAQ